MSIAYISNLIKVILHEAAYGHTQINSYNVHLVPTISCIYNSKLFEKDLYRKGHFGLAFYERMEAESSLRNVV
jgi:hypothetical protein